MHSKWVFTHFYPISGKRVRSLFALWILSLLAGIALCCSTAFDSTGIVRSAFSVAAAPLRLLFVCVFPIVAIAVTLLSRLPGLAYFPVFISGVSYGFCGILIYLAKGNAAWLLRALLLFSGSLVPVLMWWLILQSQTRNRLLKSIRIAFILACAVYVVDLFLVSPLVSDLVKYF